MDKKSIQITPLNGEKEKWHMWLGKFTSTDGIKGYYFLIIVAKKIPEYDKDIT